MDEAEQENVGTTSETAPKEEKSNEESQKKASDADTSRESASKKPRMDFTNMSTRPYLDATVVPILLQALSALARERPQDPIQYLADFLVRNKAQYSQNSEQDTSTS